MNAGHHGVGKLGCTSLFRTASSLGSLQTRVAALRCFPLSSATRSFSRVAKAAASTTNDTEVPKAPSPDAENKGISRVSENEVALSDTIAGCVKGNMLADHCPQVLPLRIMAASSTSSQPHLVAELLQGNESSITDWSRSYSGLSTQAFSKEIADILLAPIEPIDIEIKPDGMIYLPEIKYRRILNKAFGPGGWGIAPRTETHVGPKMVSREFALVCMGRLVAIARGEQEYFDPSGIPTATEGCKSNALMRCCKDLGVASELWDPRFIREFKEKWCAEVWAEHTMTKKKKKLWRRKDQPKLDYPYKE